MSGDLHVSKEKMSKNRNLRSMLFMALLLVTAFAASVFVSFALFSRATREYREEIISKAAKLAAEQIDGDKIDGWLENGADEEYVNTAELLQSICTNTPYVQYLYVYKIEPDGCHVVFDLETMEDELDQYDELPEVETDVIGDIVEFDESFAEDIPTLLEGGQIAIKESNDSFGWLLTKYEPILDSKGSCTAYVGVDISMIGVTDYNRDFLKWIASISALFLAVLAVIGYNYYSRSRKADEYDESERRREEQSVLFEQTAEALAGAIDAKDKYTNGHSRRVAEYSRNIARLAGRSEEECENIYFTALLHDVGKIGISSSIINKEGKLTNEEYDVIKTHPVIGTQILSSIDRLPYLSIGAKHHHERYDGRGYPEQLKGDDIPDIARIIAVADAYDAMTSKRSYRETIPQQIVREEIVKCSGTQFDPNYAKLMLQLIDEDTEYRMKERSEVRELSGDNELHCGEYMADISEGILIQSRPVKIRMHCKADHGYPAESSLPTLILFDALDHRVHKNEKEIRDTLYHEYAEIRIDGKYSAPGVRKVRETTTGLAPITREKAEEIKNHGLDVEVEAVRKRDHILVKISTKYHVREYILAKEDSVCYVFVALTGEHCNITDVEITESEEEIGADYIPRIAEEISYIDAPAGDIPNIQIDECWCANATQGIPITDGMKLTFHSKSLPTARLIWHCPYIVLFTSDDGMFKGGNYREFALIRFDGESWESEGEIDNKPIITIGDGFTDWNTWKALNKQGMDFEVSFSRDGNQVTTETENAGISIKDVLTVNIDVPEIYAAITGDQIAVTNIRILKGE